MNSLGTEVRSDRNVQISVVSHASFSSSGNGKSRYGHKLGSWVGKCEAFGLKWVFESQCCDYLGCYYDDGTKVEILPALGVKEDLKQPRGLQSPLSGFRQVIYYFALHCVQGGMAANMYI